MAQGMKSEVQEPSVLELLLSDETPNVGKALPEARYEVTRLSQRTGKPMVFTLRALSYGRTEEMKRLSRDSEVQILLSGCVEPDLKDGRLMEKFGGATPADMVKNMLLPGEIADLSAAVERLGGYRRTTIEEVKNG